MKFVSIVFTLFLTLILSNCTGLNYTLPDNRSSTKRDKRDHKENDFKLEDINELDYDELGKVDIKQEGCASYNSGVPSFNLASDIVSSLADVKNPVTAYKNCMAKAIDDSLKPICENEKNLDALEKENRNNDEALDQIEQARYNLENVKESVIEQFYNIADGLDRLAQKSSDRILRKNDDLWGDLGDFIIQSEAGSFTSFFESKANSVCFGNLKLRN